MTTKRELQFSIVIPAYNEESRIGPTLDGYINYFSDNKFGSHEIIVVLNGCVDGTRNVVLNTANENPHIKMIEFNDPLGKLSNFMALTLKRSAGYPAITNHSSLESNLPGPSGTLIV